MFSYQCVFLLKQSMTFQHMFLLRGKKSEPKTAATPTTKRKPLYDMNDPNNDMGCKYLDGMLQVSTTAECGGNHVSNFIVRLPG